MINLQAAVQGLVRAWGRGAGRGVVLVAVTLCATGCGFHLRTWNLEGVAATASVEAQGRSSVLSPLERQLQAAGLELVESEADVTIALLDERSDRRSVSVTDQARAAEYETSLRVRYEIDGKDGKLLDPRWVDARRVFRVDRTNIVGTSEEQALLQREMVVDLVEQIMRSLVAVTADQQTGKGG